jgi:hypothetical protein
MARDQRHGALGAEVDVSLVDHNELVRMFGYKPPDRLARKPNARGRVRIRQNDSAARPPVVDNLHPHCGIERHFLVTDSIEAAIDRIEAVGDVGEQERRIVFQKGLEGVGQNLIRAVPDEHLLGRHTAMGRDRLAQSQGARIGIEAQTIRRRGDRSERARRRRVRILVGIELDDAILPWLLARHIWRQAVDDRTPETAHDLRPNGGSHHRRTGQVSAEVRRNSPPPDAAA